MIATAECLLFFVFFLILFLSPKIVERQSAAIRAMRDVEIEHSLTGLRLLRSYFNEEQLQTPVLQFFKENLPNLSIIKNGENFEVQWNEKDDNLSMSQAPGGRDFHASLLHRLSIAYSDCSVIPSLHGFELSSDAGDGALFLSLFLCKFECGIWFLELVLLLSNMDYLIDAVRTSLLGVDNLQIRDFVCSILFLLLPLVFRKNNGGYL